MISDEVRQLIEYYQQGGVGFEVEEIGTEDPETGELVHPKAKHLVLYGLPVFLMGAHDLAVIRQHEAEIISYLEGRESAP